MRLLASCFAAMLTVTGVVALTPASYADTRVNVYQDIFGPGSSRVVWAFNWNYRAERTGPPIVGTRVGARAKTSCAQ